MSNADNELAYAERRLYCGVDLADVRRVLRAERTRLRLSMDELAEKSGVNGSTIHDIETNADGKPQLTTVARLVEGMGLTLSAFFARIEGLQTLVPGADTLKANIPVPSEGPRGGTQLPSGGAPTNEFVHEAIIIGIAEKLADRFTAAIDKLAQSRGQAPTTRPRTPVRNGRRRKTG